MQECPYCGQQNSDFEDRCVYCGELLYIQVEHERQDRNYKSLEQDINHQYAAKIARELLEDERRKQEKRKRMNKSDGFDDLARELLSSDETLFEDEDDGAVFEGDVPNNQKPDSDESPARNMFEETLAELENDIPEDGCEDIVVGDGLEEDTSDGFEDLERELAGDYKEENVLSGASPEDLMAIESNLKKKLKRNKKLETRIGLSFKNISLVLNDADGSIEVLGSVSTNTLFDNRCLELALVCYDNNSNEINRSSTVLIMNSLKTYYDFSMTLKLDIISTSMLILMPTVLESMPTNMEGEAKPLEQKNETKQRIVKKQVEKAKKQSGNSIFIEQMRDIEHKIGMKIENASVLVKSDKSLEIVGEIYIKHPDKYGNIKIAATCYDKDNNIIATENTHINTKLYLGFDTLSLKFKDVDIKNIEHIRLYPTLQ